MSEDKKPKIVACIPAYNEEKYIAKVILQAKPYVDEIIVCNDGSTDMTEEIAKALGATVINHPENMGKGAAIKALFKEALKHEPDIIVCLDADGQHDPSEIPKLIQPILNGEAEMVIGSRYLGEIRTEIPFYRRIGLAIINYLTRKTSKQPIRDTQSGFRAFTASTITHIQDFESNGYGVESEQLAIATKKGIRIKEVPINIKYKGLEKTSKKQPVAHAGEILSLILRLIVEEKPLQYLGIPGMFFIFFGISLATYLLWLFNTTRYFSIPIALITLGAVVTGITLTIAALTLYALKRVTEKLMR